MSDGGDGFELHPGDPWHPGWTDDAVEDPSNPPPHRDSTPETPKRRWFGKKARREEPEAAAAEEDHAYSEPLADPQARFRPATPFVPEPPTQAEPGAADASPPLELPAWVGDATLGAEVEAAGFEAASGAVTSPLAAPEAMGDEIGIEAPAPRPATADPAAPSAGEQAAFEELRLLEQEPPTAAPPEAETPAAVPPPRGDAGEQPSPGVIPDGAAPPPPEEIPLDELALGEMPTEEFADPFEELRRLEAAAAAVSGPVVEPSADEPPPTRYGVASKEAFAALGNETGEDDLADWAAFAGDPGDVVPRRRAESAGAAAAPAAEVPPAEESAADGEFEAEPEMRERRGIWPFRRRRRRQEEPVADEFPAIEDVWPEEDVLGPGGWSEPQGHRSAVEQVESWDDAATDLPSDPLEPPAPFAPMEEPDWDDTPVAGTPTPAELGLQDDDATAQFAPPTGRVDLPDPAGEWDDDGGAGPALDPDEEWQLAFDDGTAEDTFVPSYEPRPAASRRDEVWAADPEWDPEATVEMTDPGLGHHDDVYGMAGTVEHRGLAEEMFRLGEEDTEWQAMAAAMPGIESGVVGFEDVADLSTGDRYEEGPRSDLGARFGVGLLLAVFLLGTMFVGGAAMAVFVGAMALLGIWEFYGTLRRLEFQPLAVLGYLAAIGILATVWFHGPIVVPIGLALLLVLVYFVYAFSPMRQDALANGGLTVLAVAWVAGSVAFATPILRQQDFRMLVLALVVATVAMDIGAFAFGRAFGSRALAPVVSPNKSVEGLVGGMVVTMAAGVGFGMLVEPFDLASGIALGAVVAVMAPLGDLAESMIKRSLGVKDMGTLLPGHGGVLDRIDGFLFVLPPVWVLYRITGLLG